MARRKSKGPKQHAFRNKLLLNQWLISLFGIDPLVEHKVNGKVVRPFHRLAAPIHDSMMEGLDADNIHKFYHNLVNSELFRDEQCALSKEQILRYEENIVRHTQAINEKRHRPVVWKYYQWLTLLFIEIYLDRFLGNREGLLNDLNAFAERFNSHWANREEPFAAMPLYNEDDLNKLCMQNATGSGKTLLMHVNLLQYRHYAAKHGKDKDLSRVILLTPNERLSEQHIAEFRESNLQAVSFAQRSLPLFSMASGLGRVDVLEITKLADQEGPNTTATRSLGHQNLLLVDEGHRGMSGKEEGVWFSRRSDLCAKGFTFEYSATFEQAVQASGNSDFENSYAKTIVFDYSYRWFYEDGFGKDYKIDNLPHPSQETVQRLIEKGDIKAASKLDNDRSIAEAMLPAFMTACLLKFYQQLRIYEENTKYFKPFNIEKPLWVFVGSTVSSGKMSKDEQIVATDVALIIQFIADFLDNQQAATRRMHEILTGKGQDTGLLDKDGNDIFAGAFTCLARAMNGGETAESIYRDILARLFNHAAGGHLSLDRIKGESGEVALRVGTGETPFGLINVGDAKSLCDHVVEVAAQNGTRLTVEDSDFTEAMFASVKDSTSPVNLLIGSKKFVEGWDCWRVSTLGLMHVGRSEGSQIIQLFGRGVRLKGYEWSLKRSGHSHAPVHPAFIEELETLNVFGIEADFMEKFREFLREEGLPGNERRKIITIPLNVTYDFGRKLKILRPKRKASDGKEYDFKKDAAAPTVGDIPDYMTHNTVVADWYPRIQAMQSRGTSLATQKDKVSLREQHLSLLDYDTLFFELERFKRERSWHNFNITRDGIKRLLADPSWYTLYLPETRLNPANFDGVLLLQQAASELLKRYCDHYYNYRKREYIEPRLELRDLTPDDDNIPQEEFYQLIVDGDEEQVIQGIQQIKKDLEQKKDDLLKIGDLNACNFGKHLFQPLFHIRHGGKITILPVALGESEYQFVTDLKAWCDGHKAALEKEGMELFLLRNMSRGKGVGFFEAGNFHPDFILWMLVGGKQYVTFIEPHGLLHEGPASEKVLFHKRIKDVEQRLQDPSVILNSFILSWTQYPQLKWGPTQNDLEDMHVLFMTNDRDRYIEKLFARLRGMVK
jgi:superfamily II DNA or RNA helicase